VNTAAETQAIQSAPAVEEVPFAEPPEPAAELAAPPPIPVAPAADRQRRGQIVLIREDGSDGDTFPLFEDQTIIGRTSGDVNFPADAFLGDQHMVFQYDEQGLSIIPLDTVNGVFRRIVEQTELQSGDSFRIGQELLRFELITDLPGEPARDEEGTLGLGSPLPPDTWGRLAQLTETGQPGNSYLLSGQEVFMGRERGDILFPHDGYVSGSHAVIARANNRYFLNDLGSSNGTYVRIKRPMRLAHNDLILAGHELFRVEP